jgi:NHLM bacteriocin system ABC transporter ATP-binding protein
MTSALTAAMDALAGAAPAGRSFWLDDPDSVRLVQSGAVDVFMQRRDGDGTARGARYHYYRAAAGGLVLGVDFKRVPDDWGLVAIPLPGSTLWSATTAGFARMIVDPDTGAAALAAVHDWVSTTTRSSLKPLAPKDYRRVLTGDRLALEADDVISPGERIVWAAVTAGNALWMGRYEFAINAQAGPCPLMRDVFLRAAGKLDASIVDPLTLVADGSLWTALQLHQSFMLRYELLLNDQMAVADAERLEDKANRSLVLTREALARLMAVSGKDENRDLARVKQERLLAALEPIGLKLALKFEAPPASEAEVFARDPVQSVCDASNVRFRQVALKEEWWTTDNGPVLATIGDSKAWVALLPLRNSRYEMFDPVAGRHVTVTEAIAQTLGAFGYVFYRPFPTKPLKPFDLLTFGVHGLWRDVFWILGLSLASGVLSMVVPIASGKLIDTIIPSADIPAIWQMVAALFATSVATALFGIASSISVLRVESKMDNAVQSAVWDRVLKLPVPFFRRYTAGDLAVRINGINTIRHALSGSTVHTLLSSIFSMFNLLLLFYYSAKLAAIATVLIAAAVVLTLVMGYLKLRYERQLATAAGKLSGMSFQYLRGITKLRVAAAESKAFSNWAELFTSFRRLSFNAQHLGNIEHTFFSGYQIVITAVIFAAIGMVLFKDAGARMSTGDFIAFNAAFGALFGGLMGFAATSLGLLNLVPVYERAKPILESLPEVVENKVHPGEIQGGIEVMKLGFRYADGADVMKDVSFAIRPGGYIALVGSSGSGKSTLFRLLLGFEQPTAGSIHYDGQNLADIDVNALRRQFGVVLQTGQLMPGDIYTNIVGSANLSVDQAWEAATMVGLDEDIKQMPMGMHTVIGDGASTLSGGQRQRILIARAIVQRPRVLFFDEATSALDNRTQAIVTRSLDQLKSTRIVIAHRLSTVINADRIIVLQDGRIAQDGNYEKLIAEEGPFQALAKRQIA